jgi:hypothetical protein
MAEPTPSKGPGHYSGSNKIPTVNQLLEKLDKDKKNRDAELDQQSKQQAGGSGGAKPHVHVDAGKAGTQKTVTDPTTGRQVSYLRQCQIMCSDTDVRLSKGGHRGCQR